MELNDNEIDKLIHKGYLASNGLDIPDTEPQPTGVRPITSNNQELYSIKLNHIKSVDVQTGTIYIDYDMIKKEKSILEELNEMYDSIDRLEAKRDKYLEGYRDALNDAINVVERYLR